MFLSEMIGTALAILSCGFPLVKIEVAKLYHFTEDRAGVFRMMSEAARPAAPG